MSRRSWTPNKIIQAAKRYSSPDELRKADEPLYAAMRRYGVVEESCAHMTQDIEAQCVGCGSTFRRKLSGKGWNTRVFCDDCRSRDDYETIRFKHTALKNSFGISLFEHSELIRKQGGKCAACGDELSEDGRYVHVDHCHESGNIRGVLCFGCNVALGHARDSVSKLKGLISYLEGYNEGSG